MVRLMHAIKGLPENAIGIVTDVMGSDEGYKVEFSGCWHPHSSIVKILLPEDIERIPDGKLKQTADA